MQTKLSHVLVLLAATACGRAHHAQQQVQPNLEVPDEGVGQKPPFMLADEAETLDYNGNMLLWNPSVEPDRIQEVSDASVATRAKRADFLIWERSLGVPTLQGQAAADRQRIAELSAKRGPYVASHSDELADQGIKSLDGWFDARLKSLPHPLPLGVTEAQLSDQAFGAYCEAKLWELALHPMMRFNYHRRPTPLALCEGYYAKHQLLQRTAAACADAPAAAGANYLDCLWTEGVVKTQLFLQNDGLCPDNKTKRSAAVAAWLTSKSLQKALLADFAAGVAATDPARAFKMSSRLLGGTSSASLADYDFGDSCPNALEIDGTGDTTLEANSLAGALDADAIKTAYEGFFKQPPTTILQAFEIDLTNAANISSSLMYTFLPVPAAETPDVTKARYLLLANDVRLLGKRPDGSVAGVLARNLAAKNDDLFNHPVGQSFQVDDVLAGAFAQADHFAALRAAAKTPFDADIGAAQADLQAVTGKIAQAVALDQKRHDDLLGTLEDSAKAASKPGVSLLTSSFDLAVTRRDGAMEVRLSFNGKPGWLGCWRADHAECAVKRTPSEQSWATLARVDFDQAQNELILDATLATPTASGLFDSNTGTPVLDEAALKGKTLHFEAYAQQLHDVLDFFTGNVDLRDGDTTLHQGSVSADAFSSDSRRFVPAQTGLTSRPSGQ